MFENRVQTIKTSVLTPSKLLIEKKIRNNINNNNKYLQIKNTIKSQKTKIKFVAKKNFTFFHIYIIFIIYIYLYIYLNQ
jgi:hypothetical protein